MGRPKVEIKVGDIIGELKILNITENIYNCKCSCNTICNKTHKQIITNSCHPDCGCLEKISLIGKKFGSLLVLSFNSMKSFHLNKCKSKNWNCVCDCGNSCVISQKLLTGSGAGYKHCGCKSNNISKSIYYKNIIDGYKSKSKLRKGLKFELNELEYSSLLNSPCYYCNCPPSNLYRHKGGPVVLKYNGIDRIDSSKGYNIENVVPCCSKCNFMKNSLSYDEFIEHILSIQQNCLLPYQI